MKQPKLTVAICGGGLGGLLTAIALTHFSEKSKDIKIDIYEARDRFSETGAGISFFMRPFKVLDRLGLVDDLLKHTNLTSVDYSLGTSYSLRKSNQSEGFEFYNMEIPMGGIGFHRVQFLNVLVSHLNKDQVTTHLSKRLESYSQTDGVVHLSFQDGSTATADVLIGADGINSAARRTMLNFIAAELEASGKKNDKATAKELRDHITPVCSGWASYRDLVHREEIESQYPKTTALKRPTLYCGKGMQIAAYPVDRGKFVSVSASVFHPEDEGIRRKGKPVEEVSSEEVLKDYQDFEEEVLHMLKSMKKPSKWIVNTVKPLSRSVSGNAALLGDAAHAMTPGQGAGCGQAAEDAYVLAALLAHSSTTKETVATALKTYESIRLPAANDVHRRSARGLDLTSFRDFDFPEIEKATERELGKLRDLGFTIVDNWKWAWTTDVEDDKDKALAHLRKSLAKGSS